MVSSDEDNLNSSNYTLSSPSSSTSSFASSSLTSTASTLTLSGTTHFKTPEPFSRSSTSQETMEEVWEDINLSSLHNHSSPTFRGVILQDFFARPFSKSPSTSLPPEQYGSPPPPATRPVSLNLNTHPNNNVPFLGLVSSDEPNNRAPSNCNVGLHRMPFDRFLPSSSSPSSLLPNNGLIRRFPENERSSGGGGDRRHKRMIKNRESAARSRARKQELYLFLTSITLFVLSNQTFST